MSIDSDFSVLPEKTTTRPGDAGTNVPLEVDPGLFFPAWHFEQGCPEPVGCPLCDPTAVSPSRFLVRVKSCKCGVLDGEECGCGTGNTVDLPVITWDLTSRKAAA